MTFGDQVLSFRGKGGIVEITPQGLELVLTQKQFSFLLLSMTSPG